MSVVAQRKREEGWWLSQQYRNTFTERFSWNNVLRLLSGKVFPTMLIKFVKLLWGPFSIVIYSSQVVRGISARQDDVWTQWLLWPVCDRCYRTKRGQGEAFDQRRPTNYRKWDIRELLSFIGKLKSDPPLSPGCMEALRLLGVPPTDRGTE